MRVPRPRSIVIAIFVAVAGLYAATGSREPAWGDAHGMVDAADHLISNGSMAIGYPWPEDIPTGRDGKYYCIAPILASFVHLPGLLLGDAATAWSPSQAGMWRPLAVHLGPAMIAALIAAMFFSIACQVGATPRAASLSTVILAVGTTLWVYGRYPYSEILQAGMFLGFFGATVKLFELTPSASDTGTTELGAAVRFGMWSGLLINSKVVYGAAVLIAGVVWVAMWRRPSSGTSMGRSARQLIRTALWALVGIAPWLGLALFYNWLRWGSAFETGYGPYLSAFFGGSLFDGAWGMLASPNKSAFLYSPPLVCAVFGLPRLFRTRPKVGLAFAATVVPVFFIYASYRSWSGDYAWGPRFFVYSVPVIALGLPFFIEEIAARWPIWAQRTAVIVVLLLGISVQTLGNAFYWDHFIRISMDAKSQWLGSPNRAGSYIPERGRGHCDSCYEDMFGVMWDPPFQPIAGHWWLAQSLARGDDAATAVQHAPWRRYSTLPLEIQATYARARIDWWGLLWISDHKGRPLWGALLLVLMLGAFAAGSASWLRQHRRLER